MITMSLATTDAHFEQILALQRRYHVGVLTEVEQAAEGFVYVEHNLALLQRMAALQPQAIALFDGRVIAYCLTLPRTMSDEVPSLVPMFEEFERCSFGGRPLSAYRFVVGGQVCVDREFRGQGLLARLYRHIGQSMPDGYALCVTEIAIRNQVSVRSHEKMGFEAIATYADQHEEWVIVAWDFKDARP